MKVFNSTTLEYFSFTLCVVLVIILIIRLFLFLQTSYTSKLVNLTIVFVIILIINKDYTPEIVPLSHDIFQFLCCIIALISLFLTEYLGYGKQLHTDHLTRTVEKYVIETYNCLSFQDNESSSNAVGQILGDDVFKNRYDVEFGNDDISLHNKDIFIESLITIYFLLPKTSHILKKASERNCHPNIILHLQRKRKKLFERSFELIKQIHEDGYDPRLLFCYGIYTGYFKINKLNNDYGIGISVEREKESKLHLKNCIISRDQCKQIAEEKQLEYEGDFNRSDLMEGCFLDTQNKKVYFNKRNLMVEDVTLCVAPCDAGKCEQSAATADLQYASTIKNDANWPHGCFIHPNENVYFNERGDPTVTWGNKKYDEQGKLNYKPLNTCNIRPIPGTQLSQDSKLKHSLSMCSL